MSFSITKKLYTLVLLTKTKVPSSISSSSSSLSTSSPSPSLSCASSSSSSSSSPLSPPSLSTSPYSHVLLGLKKRGFGLNKWNGFGGKVEPGESIKQAALREMHEECGMELTPDQLEKYAVIQQEFEGDPKILEVHVYLATENSSSSIQTPVESEEMKPAWFSLASIPFSSMWADDAIWYPILLNGHRFRAHFLFKNQETMIKHSITYMTEEEAQSMAKEDAQSS